MSTLRIAHFSDTHVLSMRGTRPIELMNKRLTGAVNLAMNRARHYRVDVFERLLMDVKAQAPDHTVCTGDLVNLALEPEFVAVQGMLRAVFKPAELTVVPGNHDCYAKDASLAGRFERFFAPWQPHEIDVGGGTYPVVRLVPGLVVIGLSTAVPTPVFMATGTLGEAQVSAARRVLDHPDSRGRFRLLIIHHPLLPDPTRPLDLMRRLTDADRLLAMLRTTPVDLVVHGHNHEFRRSVAPGSGAPIIQVASASRQTKRHNAEFNIYVVRDGRLAGIERHVYAPEAGRFVPCDEAGSPAAA